VFAPGKVEDVSISKYILRRDYTIAGDTANTRLV